MDNESNRVAIVTGGSAGLGFHIALAMVRQGYRVGIVGRDPKRLEDACRQIEQRAASASNPGTVVARVANVTRPDDVTALFEWADRQFGRLDVLVNAVGASDRGLIEKLTRERLEYLWNQNVLAALLCSQAGIGRLEVSHGVIVNIGSLASKVGARYLGGYSIAKHGLAGMTSQLRLELKPRGVHVGLVSPGPIRRDDAGSRYQDQIDSGLPNQAAKPGGGTRIKGLTPEVVASAVLRCIDRRIPDIVLPKYLRPLIAIGDAFPRIGDWLLLKFTSSKND